jgi:hypothetical protein
MYKAFAADLKPQEVHAEWKPPQHTHTAVFEYENGHRVEIPEPGEGWIEGETEVLDEWPPTHASSVENNAQIDRIYTRATDAMADVIKVEHAAGHCWLWDMWHRITEDPARIVSVTRWERDPVINAEWVEYYIDPDQLTRPDPCPSQADPAPEWPEEGRPRRVING